MAEFVFSSYEIIRPEKLDEESIKDIYRSIERAGRTCYKSESRITDDSAAKFVAAMVRNGHEAMLEHAGMTVNFTVDRGITHELVRHRIASFGQESTRYCNYGNFRNVTFINPIDCFPEENREEIMKEWTQACKDAEEHYLKMLLLGASPEMARTVLNSSTKADIVVTANMREWRHIFKLRAVGTTGRPHPQMVECMMPLLEQVGKAMPELFGDILNLQH